MTEILIYWNRRWQSVAFNSETGRARVRWFARVPKRCLGFACSYDEQWYALRRDTKNLVFQHGQNIWPLDEEHRCTSTTKEGNFRVFSIYRKNELALRIEYKISRSLLEDPTADVLDVETTDFFFWVAHVWNDSSLKSNLKTGWGR